MTEALLEPPSLKHCQGVFAEKPDIWLLSTLERSLTSLMYPNACLPALPLIFLICFHKVRFYRYPPLPSPPPAAHHQQRQQTMAQSGCFYSKVYTDILSYKHDAFGVFVIPLVYSSALFTDFSLLFCLRFANPH